MSSSARVKVKSEETNTFESKSEFSERNKEIAKSGM
jgi:hypothetical protein